LKRDLKYKIAVVHSTVNRIISNGGFGERDFGMLHSTIRLLFRDATLYQ